MTEADKAERDRLESSVKQASAALRAFPRNSIGLVSDETRLTPAYQSAKTEYAKAFASLQGFNASRLKRA